MHVQEVDLPMIEVYSGDHQCQKRGCVMERSRAVDREDTGGMYIQSK